VSVTADAQARLEVYFQLLARWNLKINLTALPLRRPTDNTFDRLLIEPLAAARYVADSARKWFDVGSGGGSPAIPLKIMHPRAELTMIESKARKTAFLREAVRTLALSSVEIQNERFEDFVDHVRPHSIDLVTVRAVKRDSPLLAAVHRALSPQGRVFLFHAPGAAPSSHLSFETVQTAQLGTSRDARLTILKPLFRNNIVD
jgi:16S rRNA (guanine527-N7)-methyltransferase